MNWICTESDLTMSFCNFAFSASRFLTLGVLHEVAMRRIPIEAAIANKILFFFIMISVFFFVNSGFLATGNLSLQFLPGYCLLPIGQI